VAERTDALIALIRDVVERDGGLHDARLAAASAALHDRATIRSALLDLSMAEQAEERVEELLAALLGDLVSDEG
jgi:hypothetical protein